MKKLLALFILVPLISLGVFAFDDVENHWAKDTIDEMKAYNIVSGYPDGSFKPNKKMTRAEFIKVASVVSNDLRDNGSFSYKSGHWADYFIEKALRKGLLTNGE